MSARLGYDTVAEAYRRARPGYPPELVDRLGPPGDTLEVGCGTGQLTSDLVARGHRVVAVDVGANMIALARAACPGAEFLHTAFEQAHFGRRRFDLVTSGTAFHWVDPDIGYRKAAALLRRGGRLALLSHTVVANPVTDVLDVLVRRHTSSFQLLPAGTTAEVRARVAQADERDISGILAAIDGMPTRAVGADKWFGPPEVTAVDWEQLLTAEQALDTVKAHPGWPSVPEGEARALEEEFWKLAATHDGPYPRRRLSYLISAVRRD